MELHIEIKIEKQLNKHSQLVRDIKIIYKTTFYKEINPKMALK